MKYLPVTICNLYLEIAFVSFSIEIEDCVLIEKQKKSGVLYPRPCSHLFPLIFLTHLDMVTVLVCEGVGLPLPVLLRGDQTQLRDQVTHHVFLIFPRKLE